MQPFTTHTGLVAPLDRVDVDTDQIIPKQFLKSISRTGFEAGLFFDWRFRPDGSPVQDFVLNKPEYQDASVLISGRNFGSGSSREHAPWALQQYGFRALIAPSFADIFFNNTFKNGVLPIVLPEATVAQLFDEVSAFPGYELTIDLDRQVVLKAQGDPIPFDVQPFRRYCLMNGFDDIGLTLRQSDKIKAYESERLATKPWLTHTLQG